jgi:hypothetical protein
MANRKKKIPFTMVRRSIWKSERFGALPCSETQLLYFYFLTNPHQTATGCFVHNEAYVLADLKKAGRDWTPEFYRSRKAEVEASGLILADADTGEILIDRWWDGAGPTNEKWFEGARGQCCAIESPKLRQAAQESLASAWAAFREAKGLPPLPNQNVTKRLPDGSGAISLEDAAAILAQRRAAL